MPPMTYNPYGPSIGMQGQVAPEYNDQAAFQRLAATAQDYKKTAQQGMTDTASRFPGMASGQGTQTRLLDRDIANHLLQAQSGVQLEGMGQKIMDRRTGEANQWQEYLLKLQQMFGRENMQMAEQSKERDRAVTKRGQDAGMASSFMGSFI